VTLRSGAASFLLRQVKVHEKLRCTACFGWAQNQRTAVLGWNLLGGCREECAHDSYRQDCNPDCTFHGFVSYLNIRVNDSPYRIPCMRNLADSHYKARVN